MITKVNAKEYAARITQFLEKKDFSKPFFVFGPTGIGKTAILHQMAEASKGISGICMSVANTPEEIDRLPKEFNGDVIEFQLFEFQMPSIDFFDKLFENCKTYGAVPYFVEITCDDASGMEIYEKYGESMEWFSYFPEREEFLNWASEQRPVK